MVYRIDWRDKGVWPVAGAPVAELLGSRSLFDGSVSWPAMVLREEALRNNIDTLARFCREHDLDFAPHGKTTMSPELFRLQLDAGAWGITVATAQQARVARGFGVPRVLLANQLLDGPALDWLAGQLEGDREFEFACLVDSSEGVRAAAKAGSAHPGIAGGFPVILDFGYPGGRTGVRDRDQARALAQEVAAADGIRLLGVSAYEGGLKTLEAVREYFAEVRRVVGELAEAGLLPERPVVTAGGSAYFDLVAEQLAGEWARDLGVQVILRSGAYVTHDNGLYERTTPFNRIDGSLEAAIEVWAQVLSAPEAGIAFVGLGRRDVPFDNGLPVPLWLRRAGETQVQEISGLAEVSKLADQHCYVMLADELRVRPGDLIGFGISHPCTAFDKWRTIPRVDREYKIVGLARTYF